MTIAINGSGTITGISVGGLNDNIITKNEMATGGAWAPAGTVLQVVQNTISNFVITTSTTYVDSGLSATITPTSATSKILVTVDITGICTGSNSSTTYQAYMRLTDGSNNQIQQLLDQFVPGGSAYQLWMPYACNYLHSPNTVSSMTYKVRIAGDGSGHGIALGNYQNAAYFCGSITLTEIAA